ncbi:hypothetical protein [Streptomyces sp. HC307]|uniref:hypothetical protein n=1 Tax=Streptomyces flavusporus TaxID=3385496 RepID=UPI003916D9DC
MRFQHGGHLTGARPRPLTKEQVGRLRAACDGDAVRVTVALMAGMGMRPLPSRPITGAALPWMWALIHLARTLLCCVLGPRAGHVQDAPASRRRPAARPRRV